MKLVITAIRVRSAMSVSPERARNRTYRSIPARAKIADVSVRFAIHTGHTFTSTHRRRRAYDTSLQCDVRYSQRLWICNV